MSKRMTIEMSDALVMDMDSIIQNPKFGCNTYCQVLRNAIVLYRYLIDEIMEGHKIAIAGEDNDILKELVIVSPEGQREILNSLNTKYITE